MVHVLAEITVWAGIFMLSSWVSTAGRWAARRWRLSRAPVLETESEAIAWAIRNPGLMAQWPTGDVTVEKKGGQLHLTAVIDRRRGS